MTARIPERKTRRERGTGTFTTLKNGRIRCYLEMLPDPATGNRRRVSATGRTKAEALNRARAKQRAEDKTGPQTTRAPKTGDWCEQWVDNEAARKRAPLTVEAYRAAVKNSIRPSIGAVRLDKITPGHLRLMEDYILKGDPKTGRKPRKTSSVNIAYCVLRGALKAAIREGVINDDPTRKADPPAVVHDETTILTPAQAGQLIRAETDPMRHLMWRLAFATGMRQGEILGLLADEITETDGITCVIVEWQLKRLSQVKDASDLPIGSDARHVEGSMWLTRPKSKAGRRIVPLPADIADELRAYMDANPPAANGLVFHRDGHPITPQQHRDWWLAALKHAGLPRVKVHSARHTAATAMMEMGVADAVRKSIMGHSSIETTNTVYTHIGASLALTATTGIERAISA